MGVASKMHLDGAKRGIWIYIGIFTILMMFHQAWSPTASNFKHTYELGSPPGQLTTDRGTLDFLIMFTLAFMWLVPITAALMTTFIGSRWIEQLHLIITFLLWLWFILVFAWQVYSWAIINPDPTAPGDMGDRFNNPASDKRWCCVYGFLGPPCHLDTFNTTCSPYVAAEMLGVNPTFVFSFIMNLILVVLLTFDFFWVTCSYQKQVTKAIRLHNVENPTKTNRRFASTKPNYKSSTPRIGLN